MALRFTKMHGLGNDYVYVSLFDQTVAEPEKLAVRVSDRHRGVGSDGLILIAPPDVPGAHVRMLMYNVDGTPGEMCGNGIRCVAKYAYERGLARHNPLRVQTGRGVLELKLNVDAGGRVDSVEVDMDEPILEPKRIPVVAEGQRVVGRPIELEGETLTLTCVSMGNPHAVFFQHDIHRVPLATWGPVLERHPLFPQRINVHFAQVMAPDALRMVTWERGSGITQACGTGACAVAVAGVLNGLSQRDVTVHLPGGALRIRWEEATNHVHMTGPAEEVFDGEWLETRDQRVESRE